MDANNIFVVRVFMSSVLRIVIRTFLSIELTWSWIWVVEAIDGLARPW